MRHAAVAISIAGLMLGCGGASPSEKTANDVPKQDNLLGTIGQGVRCDANIGREALVDLNQDGHPDVRKVFKTIDDTEVLICREADLNFDGVKDVFVFFDDTGTIIRDEVDLDFDKQIDIISTYAKGEVVRQEIDTNSDGMVDRIRLLKNQVPFRLEGDTNGDGQVDLWEYYEEGKLVRIGTDDDGDGRADSWIRDKKPQNETTDEHEDEQTETMKTDDDDAKERTDDATDKTAEQAPPVTTDAPSPAGREGVTAPPPPNDVNDEKGSPVSAAQPTIKHKITDTPQR